jgi:hypothetical protein
MPSKWDALDYAIAKLNEHLDKMQSGAPRISREEFIELVFSPNRWGTGQTMCELVGECCEGLNESQLEELERLDRPAPVRSPGPGAAINIDFSLN